MPGVNDDIRKHLSSSEGLFYKQQLIRELNNRKRYHTDSIETSDELKRDSGGLIKPRRRSKRVRTTDTIETLDDSDSSSDSSSFCNEGEFESEPNEEKTDDSFSISYNNSFSGGNTDNVTSKTADDTSLSFFHNKLLEFEKVFQKLPNNMAKVNAEIAVMSSTLRTAGTVHSNKDFVPWAFELLVEWQEEAIVLPIKEARLIVTFDEALQDESIRAKVYKYMSVFYGENQLRNMSKAAFTLFKSLIGEQCFSEVIWKRKDKNGPSRIQFVHMKNIQNIILEALQSMDKNYTIEDLHKDIVYKILPRK